MSDLNWMEQAACRSEDLTTFFGTPDMFKGGGHHVARAKKICALCPVRMDCLKYVIEVEREHGPQSGVWAGLSEQQRQKIRISVVRRRAS